jgi:NADPH:quinone reductase-like Zn-dependent oxidoreductase
MKAVQIKSYGHIDALEIVEVEKPRPGKGQVLCEVYASSINPFDRKVREGLAAGRLKLSFPVTLGFDMAGVIVELGQGVRHFHVGDRVYGEAAAWSGGTGAYAEYCCANENLIAKMPANIGFAEAAALVMTGVSALQGITEHIKLKSGKKILIHGGAGGIGTFAIELAKHIGAYVATTSSGAGIDYCKRLGADEVIDYKTQKFEDILTNYDYVFDTVDADTYTRSYRALKKGGLIVSLLSQPDTALAKRFGVKAMYQSTQVNAERLDKLRRYVEDGVITVHVHATFALDRIREAFEAKEKGGVLGKVVIEMKEAALTGARAETGRAEERSTGPGGGA